MNKPFPALVSATGADDPLLAALIGKLPAPGDSFSGEARANWLKLMAMAFDVIWGVAEDMPVFVAERAVKAPAQPAQPARAKHAGHDFYISPDGLACREDGSAVLMSDVPPDEAIFDYRLPVDGWRDKDGILWADGSRGTAGIAPGVSFCGPG